MTKDDVNQPSHYTEGRAFEVIEVLEDWVSRAPDPVLGGLQWNSLKYLGRVWDKESPLKDAKKSRWYLNRLIDKLEAAQATEQATEQVPFTATYEDVLEDQILSALEGNDPWDSDDYLWDPSLGPVDLSQSEVQEILKGKDLDKFHPDEIVSTVEKRGLIIGFKRDGSSCLLGSNGSCE